MRRSLSLAVLLVAPALVVARPPDPAPTALPPAVRLPGGGVADAEGKVGYLPGPGGGTYALDLADGRLLWQTAVEGRLLLGTARHLVTLVTVPRSRNQAYVVVLDGKQGGRAVLQSQPLPFPEWVAVAPAPGRAFVATGVLDGRGGLLVVWRARGWYGSSAGVNPDLDRQARLEASGVTRVDLRSGAAEALTGARVPRGLPVPGPAELASATVAGRVFTLEDRTILARRQAPRRKRTLHVADTAGRRLWQREIGAPAVVTPLP